jgi:hypothetical protein
MRNVGELLQNNATRLREWVSEMRMDCGQNRLVCFRFCFFIPSFAASNRAIAATALTTITFQTSPIEVTVTPIFDRQTGKCEKALWAR